MLTSLPKLRRRTVLAAAAATVVSPVASLAQTSGSQRPVTIIVPFAPGGGTDITARRLAERMAPTLNLPVVVENKPGAGGFPAVQALLAAPRDGHTLMISGSTSISLMPLVYSKLPFSMDDLVPLSTISRQPYTVNASPMVPTESLERFLAWARAKPDEVTFGTTGIGTVGHILAEWIGQALGLRYRTIPYRGVAQGAVDLMAGRIDLQVDSVSTSLPTHKAGKTRILAGTGAAGERSILPPGVRNLADMGYPDLVAHVEFGLFTARGAPEDVTRRLFDSVVAATRHPELVNALAVNGELALASASPAEYAARVAQQKARWTPIVRSLNIDLN
jgi:tripartite-type tricarboxylate transporter receptor subunit TctC